MPTVDTVEADALQLSVAERELLVERLILSLDTDPAVEEAWAAEIDRRLMDVENGTVQFIPGPEALAKLKAEFT